MSFSNPEKEAASYRGRNRLDEQELDSDEFNPDAYGGPYLADDSVMRQETDTGFNVRPGVGHIESHTPGLGSQHVRTRGRFCRWLSDRIGNLSFSLAYHLSDLADWLYYKKEG